MGLETAHATWKGHTMHWADPTGERKRETRTSWPAVAGTSAPPSEHFLSSLTEGFWAPALGQALLQAPNIQMIWHRRAQGPAWKGHTVHCLVGIGAGGAVGTSQQGGGPES